MHLINKSIPFNANNPAAPLDVITVIANYEGSAGSFIGHISVTDGKGMEYFNGPNGEVDFTVGGALGVHTVRVTDNEGNITDERTLAVDAISGVDDNEGKFKELFGMLAYTMNYRDEMTGDGAITHRGKVYKNFMRWILDHTHTARGLKYLSPDAAGLVDIMRETQREDGMVWSNIRDLTGAAYHYSAYHAYGYARIYDDVVGIRQPVENHCEYMYVDCAHLVWQSSGDDEWMRGVLESCKRALDYTRNQSVRWSEQYQLPKKGYTIDSWDFQPWDKYLVEFPMGKGQLIDPERTKFTIFYGDNQGYANACELLAEMLTHAGYAEDAEMYVKRAAEIRERTDALFWNGRFYRHRIEEDPAVVRDFGVDESTQVNMSNCYALNRGCTHEKATAIIRTYMELGKNLPNGSPGEFYAIYPPYETAVFNEHGDSNGKWQYMNGGVHPHAAGELARGTFRHGFEKYGADILMRVMEMGKKSNGLLRFAYTGAYEPDPPAQTFTPIDLSGYANMDTGSQGASGAWKWMSDGLGNSLHDFPTGRQTFADIPYVVADPEANGRKVAAAVSTLMGLPKDIEIPINGYAGSAYMLHATTNCPESNISGFVTYRYDDGTECIKSVLYGKHIETWYFSDFTTDDAGIAWKGYTDMVKSVFWAEIVNPHPNKKIKAIKLTAGPDGAIYAVLGMTLSDRKSYKRPPYASHGGPDNWSGGLCMAALMEGLAGVTDRATAYGHAEIAPRWVASGTEEVTVTARYAASDGYVKYTYRHDAQNKHIKIIATSSGRRVDFNVLLPEGAVGIEDVYADHETIQHGSKKVEESLYATFSADLSKPLEICVNYLFKV